jgi:Flp pilus assembly protein TadB
MTQNGDPLLQALARLPIIEPGAEWEAGVRERCHSAIKKQASRRARTGMRLSVTSLIDLAAAAALCAYWVAAVVAAAKLLGLV